MRRDRMGSDNTNRKIQGVFLHEDPKNDDQKKQNLSI